jgi:SOS response regulatory protein OraA/RecX
MACASKEMLGVFIFCLLVSLVAGGMPAHAMSSEALIALKQAEISDETIRVLMEEKALETAAFTVEELVSLKKAGISEETIQLVVREGSFMNDREPVVYGKELRRPLSFTTAQDIIDLKNAGISDEVIKAIIVYDSEDSSDEERDRAWEMLTNTGIVVDKRKRR